MEEIKVQYLFKTGTPIKTLITRTQNLLTTNPGLNYALLLRLVKNRLWQAYLWARMFLKSSWKNIEWKYLLGIVCTQYTYTVQPRWKFQRSRYFLDGHSLVRERAASCRLQQMCASFFFNRVLHVQSFEKYFCAWLLVLLLFLWKRFNAQWYNFYEVRSFFEVLVRDRVSFVWFIS